MAAKKYHVSMRSIHWLMAFLLIALIFAGWYMTRLPAEHSMKEILYQIHKSVGVIIFALLSLRIFFKLFTKVPKLPTTISAKQRKLAILCHRLMYWLMLAIPLSGYLMTNLYGSNLGFLEEYLPILVYQNNFFAGVVNYIHVILAYLLLVLIIIHILAALQHRFLDHPTNDVLARML